MICGNLRVVKCVLELCRCSDCDVFLFVLRSVIMLSNTFSTFALSFPCQR